MAERKYVAVGVALDRETLELVDRLAEEQERNRSQTIRLLLRQALRELPAKRNDGCQPVGGLKE